MRALGGAARRKVDSVSGPFLDGAASLLPPSGVGFVLTCVCVCARAHACRLLQLAEEMQERLLGSAGPVP